MARILLIEKEDRARALLRCGLPEEVKLKAVSCVEAAMEKLANHRFDMIVWNASAEPAESDHKMAALCEKAGGTRTLVLTSAGYPSAAFATANLCIREQPVNEHELIALIRTQLACEGTADQGSSGAEAEFPIEFEGLTAVSLPMLAVIRQIRDAAAVDIPVLVTGETGTGKDLVAAAIHRRSRRRSYPYIPVNTGAIARELIASELFGHERGAFTGAQETHPGIFEQADRGTVFLDEVATMDEKSQVSLLRVLEEKTVRRVGGNRNIAVDVRIIAATNENLERKVVEKGFREDLFYRLNVFHINLPPLRARTPSAVTVLTDKFVSYFAAIYGKEIERVAPETYRLLRRYPWPGNVRELKNVIQTALLVAEGKELRPDFIPERIRHAVASAEGRAEPMCQFRFGASLSDVQNEFIRMTLSHVGGNKKMAASILGISRRALYNKLKSNGSI